MLRKYMKVVCETGLLLKGHSERIAVDEGRRRSRQERVTSGMYRKEARAVSEIRREEGMMMA